MMRIQLLGQPSADVDGTPVPGIERSPKKLAILAYLALHPAQKFVPREALLAQFWPESPEKPARHALSQSLHFIRQTFGADALITSGTQLVRLNPNTVGLDVREFEASFDRNDWQEVAQLYRGDLLEGITLEDSEAADWLDRERQRLRARAADALWQHAAALLEHDADAAVRVAERAIICDPTREPACLAFLEAALQHKRINAARTIATSFPAALARATDGDGPTPAFSERVRQLQTIGRFSEKATVDERAATIEATPIVPLPGVVNANPAPPPRRRWFIPSIALALIAGIVIVVRTIAVRAAAGSEPAPATMQFVIEPINAPDELRPYADAFVANIADELSDGEWDVVLPGSQQSQKEPPAGYRFAVHAFGTGDTAHLSYQVKDVFSGEVVTSEVLPFGVHSDVVAASTQLIRKIRVELGRSHRVFGNLSRSERSAWETLVRQHSLADSLRNAGDFGAAARAYGVLDSLYTMQRWGARVALMFGVERLRGRRASVFSESMRGNTDLDSLINEAERMAADLIDRFPNRFEAREARGLVRHQRVLLGKTKSLLALIDSAVADLQPPTADKGSPEGLTALSGLLLNRGDWAAARTYALAALKRDNFLEHENANLMQLYVASFNLGEDDLARRACKEINANFPRQNIGVACRLELMGWSDTEPLDLAEARRIAREGNANDPPYLRAHTEKEANLLLAAIMFRAGEIAEARELANSVDVSTDTNTGLLGQKAAVLARFGDSTRARELAAGDALHGVLTQIALEKMRVYKGLLPKH